MDGLLTAVFYAFSFKEQPEALLAEGDEMPLFCERVYRVATDEEKAHRVWAGLEKKLSREAMRLISVSWLSELREVNAPLFRYICKVFRLGDISRNFADSDVLVVTNIAFRKLMTGHILPSFRPTIMCCRSLSTISRTDSTTSLGSSTMPNGIMATITTARPMPCA